MCSDCRCGARRLRSNIGSPRLAAAARCALFRSGRPAAWPSRARRPLSFPLPACWWLSWTPEIDDRASRSRSASMASAACGRGTCGRYLASLGGNEGVEIGVGEPDAPALLAVADVDAGQRAGSDVRIERLDGAAELACGLGGRAQAIRRRGNGRLRFLSALAVGELGEPCQTVAPTV